MTRCSARRAYMTAVVGFVAVQLSVAGSRATTLIDPVARSHVKRLELLRLVLHRDASWGLVLNQRVKLTPDDRPPYGDAATTAYAGVGDRLRLIGEGAVAVTPLSVVRTVIGKFAWLGSYVEYAERLLRKAFACVAYVHVSHVVEILQALEMKTAEALKKKAAEEAKEKLSSGNNTASDKEPPGAKEESGKALQEKDEEEEEEEEEEEGLDDRFSRDVEPFRMTFSEAWSTLTMLVDKLAAVGGNLDLMADLSNVLGNALVSGQVIPFPVVELMRREIDGAIDRHCDRHEPKQVYLELGYKEVWGDPFGKTATPAGLKMSIGSIFKKLFAFYCTLQIETLAPETWAQLFNYQNVNANNVTLHSTLNAMMEKNNLIKRKVQKFNRALKVEYARIQLKKIEEEEEKDQKIDK